MEYLVLALNRIEGQSSSRPDLLSCEPLLSPFPHRICARFLCVLLERLFCLLTTTGQFVFESLNVSFKCVDALVFLFERGFEFVETI